MTIQQLEYIIAVDNYRHFAKAAEACYVTQPTLSMMIQKLEDELEVKVFDRMVQPVAPTEIGAKIIKQAHTSIYHFNQIKELVNNERNVLAGDFKLGVIPTIASYLVPELLHFIQQSQTEINLLMQEIPTYVMVENILNGKIDGGLAATPLKHPRLVEIPIYYEKFYVYLSSGDALSDEEEIDLKDIDIRRVWLLNDIHCLRGQVEVLCKRKKENDREQTAHYESGSLDTLINIVDYNGGLTIIPEMTAMGLPEEKQNNLRKIKGDISVREISLVVSRDFVRQKMANAIVDMIRKSVPKSMLDHELKKFVVDVHY
ncbi:MAG: hydrogen peroxide-inducible genes activator [Tannerella sp.]|jgi:LysR family hydrogen peroxide-inducible transcriptional activator|nr:hydrogen peroxide-inducible genes activator [Tannerella sp.]